MPKQGMADPIDQYVAELLRAAGLDSLPEEARAGFLEKLRDQVQRRIGIIAVQHLDPKGIEEFQGLMMKTPPPAPDAVQEFFVARIPNFEQIMQEGLRQFADEFIAASKTGA
ncbi:hypothetical protein HY632_02990 [Candidatus Uhrbacteria bacterium]|nr:hypothetical protein [Candidatus Uhrbacteria bacterium]